ncbi:MAG: hypothetical protein R3B49_06795 [Phycisphaerales bacterium]
MPFLNQLRLRVFAVLAGVITAVVAALSLTAWPAVPVIGVAILTAAALVNGMTARLNEPTCAGCGRDLAGQESGEYGVICPECGAITLMPSEQVDRQVHKLGDTAGDESAAKRTNRRA